MDELNKTVSVVGPSGIQEVLESDVPGLEQAGYRRATEKEIQYNQPTQQLLGAGEAVGRGLFGPAFTAAEKYLFNQDVEDIKGREENLGGLATGLELGSLILPGMALNRVASLAARGLEATQTAQRLATAAKFTQAGVAEGLANVASKGIEGKIAKMAMHFGVDNAVFSVLDDTDKMLLSSEPKDAIDAATSMVGHAGLSFLVGAGGGAGVGKLGELWKARKASRVRGALEAAKAAAETGDEPIVKAAEEAVGAEAAAAQAAEEAVPKAPVRPAASLEELETQMLGELVPEMPAFKKENRKSIEEALGRLPDLEIVPSELDLRMQEDAEIYRLGKVAQARNDKPGARIRNHLMIQKKHYVDKLNETVNSLAEGITGDKFNAGNEIAEGYTKKYVGKRTALGEGFKEFDSVANAPLSGTEKLLTALKESFPNIENYLVTDKKGKLKLGKFLGKEGYTAESKKHIEYVLNLINDAKTTLGETRNTRELIRDDVSKWGTSGKTKLQSGALAKKMFGIMEAEAEALGIKNIRETFKEYAINETERDIMEKILQGDLLGEGVLQKEIKPENVVDRIFLSTTTINDAKKVLGPELYKKAFGEWIQGAVNAATDAEKKTFSSAKMANWLKKNAAKLEVAAEGNQAVVQRLKDLTELMKVIPDSMPANPSGTAPTLVELLKDFLSIRSLVDAGAVAGTVKQKAFSAIESQINKTEINNMMKGKEFKPGVGMYRFLESGLNINPEAFQAMQDYVAGAAQGAYLFSRAAKAVFSSDEKEPIKPANNKTLEKLDREMQSMAANPEKMLDVGGQVGYYMPEQAQAIGLTTSRVAAYLSQKRPGIKPTTPLSKPIPPSKAETAAYQRTLQIAENPLFVLTKIKQGQLQLSDVMDLKGMYPEVYNKMLMKLTDSVLGMVQENKTIPFKLKKSLSLFTGQPLEASLTPQAIQAAQATYAQQGQALQGPMPQMAQKSSRKSQLPSMTQTDQQRRMLER